MQDWITGTLAVLGTLLILAGATLIVLRTVGVLSAPAASEESGASAPPPAGNRRWSLRRLSPASQLIVWGVLLLVISAITVGLVSFGFSVDAGAAGGSPGQ